jgi:hypothetical protein
MATRLYFPETAPAPVAPPAPGAEWEHVNAGVTRKLLVIPDDSALTTTSYAPDAADDITDKDALHRQYVSDPLAAQNIAAQTVTGQFQCLEDNAANNLSLTFKIYIVSNDGTTAKETLLAITRDGTEAGGVRRNLSFSGATTTAADIEAGDRLVIEVGLGGTCTAAGGLQGHNGSMCFGCSASSGDLPIDDTETGPTFRPWVNFANTLTFQPPDDSVGDSWWAGAVQCFAAIPFAGALAATAFSASLCFGYQQQTDEIVPLPASAIEEAYAWQATARSAAASIPVFWIGENIVPQPVADGGLYVGGSAVLPFQDTSFLVTPWVAETEVPPQPAFAAEEGSWWASFPPPLQRGPDPPLTDDETLPGAHVVADDDTWQPPGPAAGPSRTGPWWGTEDLPSTPTAAIEDEGSWRTPVLLEDSRLLLTWGTGGQTDAVTPPAGFVYEEDPWRPEGRAQPGPESVWLVVGHEPLPTHVEEEYWWQGPPPPAPPVRLVWAEDEQIGPLAPPADEPYWWIGLSWPAAHAPPVQPVLLPPWRDDERPTSPVAFAADEDGWGAPFQVQVPPGLRLVNWDTDDRVPPVLGIDEEPWSVRTPLPPAAIVTVFRDPDEIPAGSLRGPAEEMYCAVHTPSASRPIAPLFVAEDETVPVLKAEEKYWQVYTPPPPPPKFFYNPDPDEIPAGTLQAPAICPITLQMQPVLFAIDLAMRDDATITLLMAPPTLAITLTMEACV